MQTRRRSNKSEEGIGGRGGVAIFSTTHHSLFTYTLVTQVVFIAHCVQADIRLIKIAIRRVSHSVIHGIKHAIAIQSTIDTGNCDGTATWV